MSMKFIQSKTCLKQPLKIDKTKIFMTNGSLIKVESIAAFFNTFDLHKAIIGLENQFLGFLRVYTSFTVPTNEAILNLMIAAYVVCSGYTF